MAKANSTLIASESRIFLSYFLRIFWRFTIVKITVVSYILFTAVVQRTQLIKYSFPAAVFIKYLIFLFKTFSVFVTRISFLIWKWHRYTYTIYSLRNAEGLRKMVWNPMWGLVVEKNCPLLETFVNIYFTNGTGCNFFTK